MNSDQFELNDKVIVVTGASGALAGSVAHYLLNMGARVAFLSRNLEKLESAVAQCGAQSDHALAVSCDVTDSNAVELAAEKVLSRFGCVDALINGAGGNMPGATIQPDQTMFDLDLSDYDKVVKLNLHGTLLPSLTFGKLMAERQSGSIVNFSSMAATHAITRVLGYSNAKAAVDNLTRWMAMDFAKSYGDRIRVNAVAPGFFVGEQNRKLLLNEDGSLTERGKQIVANTPMGRFGEAEEVCGAVHFLLSDAARFVTGTVIAVDGGFSIYSGV